MQNQNRNIYMTIFVAFVILLGIILYLESQRVSSEDLEATVDSRVAAVLTDADFESTNVARAEDGAATNAAVAESLGLTAEAQRPIVLTDVALAYPSDTPTPTDTPTNTPTNTATYTPTNTPTNTLTNTATYTPSNTPTNTHTPTATFTPTITNTPTDTPTLTLTATASVTPASLISQGKLIQFAGIYMEISPDSKYIATNDFSDNIILLDLQGDTVTEIELGRMFNSVSSIAWSSEGRYLAASDWGDNIVVWDVAKGKEVASFRADLSIFDLEWSPDGTYLVASNNSSLTMWETETWKLTDTYEPDGFAVIGAFAIMQDNSMVLYGNFERIERVNIATNLFLNSGRLITLNDRASAMSFSPDGKKLAVGLENGIISIHNANKLDDEIHLMENHRSAIRELSWSPNGQYLVSAGENRFAYVWNTQTGELLYILEHENNIYGAQWFNDRWVITNSSGFSAWELPLND